MKMIKTKMMREKKARHKRQESLSLRPVILGLKGRDCQKLEVLKAYQYHLKVFPVFPEGF